MKKLGSGSFLTVAVVLANLAVVMLSNKRDDHNIEVMKKELKQEIMDEMSERRTR